MRTSKDWAEGSFRFYNETRSYMSYDSFMCIIWFIYRHGIHVTWLRHTSEKSAEGSLRFYDVTHLYVWRDSFKCMTWSFTLTIYMSYDSCIPAKNRWRDLWKVYYVTHSYMGHNFFVCMAWLIYTCDIRVTWFMHMRKWSLEESLRFYNVTWLIPTCGTTHFCLWHDSFMYRHTYDMAHA